MKKPYFILMTVILLVLPFVSLAAQQKFALVIGNGAYASVTRLNNPVNDATDIKAALEGLGFQVDLILNGTLRQMNDAVRRLSRSLSAPGSYGFFFYAGHGVQSKGENYLIPVNADIKVEEDLAYESMNVQRMLDSFQESGSALNMIVLDACRDNPYGFARSGNRGLTVVASQPPDSIIMYATSAGRTASDGQGRNGLFTSQLLKNLKTPGLEVKEIFNRTGSDVRQVSGNAQIPAIYSQFFGSVYLNGQTAQAVQPVSDGFVRIPDGTFTMGSPVNEAGRLDYEGSQHQVTISKAFYMGKYEVTQREYQAVMGTNPSNFKGSSLPVEQVSWFDAVEYCNKRSQREGLTPAYTISGTGDSRTVTWDRNASGYRLPTEAEWEYACRAGTSTPYYSGGSVDNAGWDGSNSGSTTHPVGGKQANAWGLYDMHGNVLEWCWDYWYGSYSSGAQTDPVGASLGTNRMIRSGSWASIAHALRSAYRGSGIPSYRENFLGFRLVRP
jgi:formylglycine-generating enzyme required for sulfatase activity